MWDHAASLQDKDKDMQVMPRGNWLQTPLWLASSFHPMAKGYPQHNAGMKEKLYMQHSAV